MSHVTAERKVHQSTPMSAVEMKHPIEGEDSWIAHLSRNGLSADDVAAGDADQTTVTADTNIPSPTQRNLRRLSKAHKSNQDDDDEFDPVEMENLKYEKLENYENYENLEFLKKWSFGKFWKFGKLRN